jgi:hypothetical protein
MDISWPAAMVRRCGNEIAQRHGDAGWRSHNAPDDF